ncbi:MAG: hypothetical protein ACI4SF_03005 [Oscillospiraceae bacterium]
MKKRLLSLFAAFANSSVLSACQAADTEQETHTSEVTEPTVEMSETVIASETAQTSFLTEESTHTDETATETSSTETVETVTIAGRKYDVNQESIYLYESDITNEDIHQLAHFNNLKKLSLDLYSKKPDVTDLSPLWELKTVENLYINGTYTDLSFIEGMTNLNSLTLEHFFCETLENVPQNATVTTFNCGESKISDISWIANFSELNELNLAHFDCDDYSPISIASKLKTLSMFIIESENTDVKFLENLTLLEYFDFYPVNSTCNFDAVSNCTNLDYLCVYAGIEDLEFCNSLNKLREFSFYSADDRKYDISPLLNCTGLEKMSLFCNFSEEDFNELKSTLKNCEISSPKSIDAD